VARRLFKGDVLNKIFLVKKTNKDSVKNKLGEALHEEMGHNHKGKGLNFING